MLFLIFLILTLLKLNFCENSESSLQRPISNTVLVSNRINNVVIAITKNCNEECYKKLLDGINYFDRMAWENDQKFKRTRVWTTFVTIGRNEKIVLEDRDGFDKNVKCLNCNFYNNSIVDNVEEFVLQFFPQNESCPSTAIKEYILIATDVCLPFLNKQFYNATNECPKDYRRHGILMDSTELVQDCLRQMTEPICVNLFSNNNLTLDTLNPYIGSQKAIYYSKLIESSVNFLIISNNELKVPFNAVRCKFYDNSYRSCNNGIFYGIFQHIYGNSQNFSEFIIPLFFNENINTSANYFMENFEYLVNKFQNLSYDEKNCSLLESFFVNARSSDNKYNVLLLEDPYPSCFDFDSQWKYSYKYLEIVIVYSNDIKSFYSNETKNHVTFLEKSGDYSKFCQPNNLCTVSMDSTLTTPQPLEDADGDNDDDMASGKISKNQNSTFSFWGLIAGIAILLIFIFAVLWLCKVGEKNKQLNSSTSTTSTTSEKSIFKTSGSMTSSSVQENVKIDSFKKQMTKENKKHWVMFLDAKNIVFNFNDVLGRGANSVVYKAFLKGNNSFHYIQKCRRTSLCVNCNVAIKLPIKFEEKQAEEFIRELNFLLLLQSHPNIITLMGWTIFADTPALLTELAETNLLNFVQSFKNQEIPQRAILQILLQISQALVFIAEQGIIHRDVACRNVLITDERIAKLGDFGLCCLFGDTVMHRDSLYKRFPIKWLSIEVLESCEFSEKSDVWAFGILCYEIFSHAAIPYSDMSYSEMLQFLQNNQRLKKPAKTPYLIYELMLACWKKDPKNRPKFHEISQSIRNMLEKETANYGYLNLKVAAVKGIQ